MTESSAVQVQRLRTHAAYCRRIARPGLAEAIEAGADALAAAETRCSDCGAEGFRLTEGRCDGCHEQSPIASDG